MGFTEPTPVQQQVIPLVLQGSDVVAAAQTGTGKTAAFALPAIDQLGHAQKGQGPLMVVVTPTRELASQIAEVCEQIVLSTHHRVVTVVGGLSYRPQISRLAQGCDILIATPGRLIDLMEQGAVRLGNVEVLVLDEADRMLDMGFLPQVRKIVSAMPGNRQTLLLSATIDASIMDVAGSYLRSPQIVEIAHKGDVAQTIDHFAIQVPQQVKPALLKALLNENPFTRVIVFARTRSRADSTARRLRKSGFSAEAIHSDRSQNQRKRALQRFSSGEVNIIVATDVLARGIDVDEVDYVVNLDVPDQPEDYIHRIGRTGRAGHEGFAVTFVTPETRQELRAIEKLLGNSIPPFKMRAFDMEEATAEAAKTAMAAKASRDPEVRAAKRALGSAAAAKRRKTATPKTKSAQNAKSSNAKAAKGAQSTNNTKQAPKRAATKSTPHSDMRPGRAHRAEVSAGQRRKRTRH